MVVFAGILSTRSGFQNSRSSQFQVERQTLLITGCNSNYHNSFCTVIKILNSIIYIDYFKLVVQKYSVNILVEIEVLAQVYIKKKGELFQLFLFNFCT